jgi:hypothetical protein
MKKLALALAILFLQFQPPLSIAADYSVNVTRKGANLYQVTGKNIYIQTRYCYEYVYYSDAILRMQGYSGEIIFLNEGKKCDVKGVYGSTDLKPGTYQVTVSREADDWYEILGMDAFIKTMLCLRLALGEDAVLKVEAGGVGKLIFDDGDNYLVEGVYSRLSL